MPTYNYVKHPGIVKIRDGVDFDASDNRYKNWDYLDNLKTGGKAYCRHPDYQHPYIATLSGTYNRPAPLDMTNFGFNIPASQKISAVVVRFKHQAFGEDPRYLPNISAPVVTLLGTNVASQSGIAVTGDERENTLTFKGLTPAQINSTAFGLRIAYPTNTASATGRITLSEVEIEVITNEEISISLWSSVFKNPAIVGETFALAFTVKKNNTGEYTSVTNITLPDSVSFVRQTSNESITRSGNNIYWNPSFTNADNVKKTLTIEVKAIKVSSQKTVVLKETKQGLTFNNTILTKEASVTLSTDFYKKKFPFVEETSDTFHVTVQSDDLNTVERLVSITLPTNRVSWINQEELRALAYVTQVTTNTTTERTILYIDYVDTKGSKITFPINVKFNLAGDYNATFEVYNKNKSSLISNVINVPFLVNPKSLGILGYSYFEIPHSYTLSMADGIEYTAGCNSKYTLSNNNYAVMDYGDVLRMGVFNSSRSYLNDEQAFLENTVWSSNSAKDVDTEQKVNFVYNENNPLIFVYAHMHVNDPVGQYVIFSFSDVILIERELYNEISGYGGIIPWQPPSFAKDEEYAIANIPKDEQTVPVTVFDWNTGGLFNQDVALHGLQVQFDYSVDSEVIVTAYLRLTNSLFGSRNIILQKGTGTATLGTVYDLFDLKISDFYKRLDDIEISLVFENNVNTTSKINVKNVRIITRTIKRVKCGYGFSVDGERSEDYGIFVQNYEIHAGTENDEATYKVTGTDNKVINRLNVDSKELVVEIKVTNCIRERNIYQIDKIVDLFTNRRELNSNKPILKKIVFDDIPDREYRFVRVKEFDDEWENGTYNAKIKLEIPDGTSYQIQPTQTGKNGYASATITIKPTILLRNTTKNKLILNETMLNQTMIINTTLLQVNDMVTIDNENREAYITRNGGKLNLTEFIDFNSTWFRIKGNYNFECSTGTILSVQYNERR